MFAMIAMLFFLVAVISSYVIISKRAQAQTESLGLIQDQYYQEGEEEAMYNAWFASPEDKIPVYTKEQFWSIGEARAVEIDGKIYDYSSTDYEKYELKNDIIINIETDLENAKFKDDLVYGDKITKNGHQIMFYGCKKLDEIVFGPNFVATNVEDMSYMFNQCTSLTKLDLSSFKDSKVTTMERMFCDATNLKSVNLSNFKTESVTSMNTAFLRCSNLTSLDMRSASYGGVTDYARMFEGINSGIQVIVKDDTAKTWVQGKLGTGVGTVLKWDEI